MKQTKKKAKRGPTQISIIERNRRRRVEEEIQELRWMRDQVYISYEVLEKIVGEMRKTGQHTMETALDAVLRKLPKPQVPDDDIPF